MEGVEICSISKVSYSLLLKEGSNKICSLACTPNGVKLAVVGRDRVITLIDEKGDVRDRFSSKPLDSKYGKKSYAIKSVCFSPDSSRLAVAQSDNVVYVYKLGESWQVFDSIFVENPTSEV
ncbi:WD domain, G-beta repeat protein [Ostertagia ostertagi]